MFPFYFGPGCWWFLPFMGIIVFMVLACFLFRRVFHGGAFCCAGGARGRDAASGDPLGILKSRYAKGEISREEYERMRKEIREEDREGGK
ncbi:MAG: SHOCT domain-containing protein [Deltaproteobacteria bacterium]